MTAAAVKPNQVVFSQRRCEINDIDAHIALSRTAYSDPRTVDPAHLHWKFVDCPDKPCLATSFHADGTLIGRSMRMDRPFVLSPSELIPKAGTISDLLLDPNFRRPDMMIRLVRAGSDLTEMDLILHGSNEYSLPIYEKLFKYPVVFRLTARGFPLRASRPLRKLFGVNLPWVDLMTTLWRGLFGGAASLIGRLSGITLEQGDISPAEFAQIYKSFETWVGPHFRRTAAFARWRFKDGPLFNARLMRVIRQGKLIGYVAIRDVDFEGLNLSVVIDIALADRLTSFQRTGLALAIAAAGGDKADAVVALANFDNDFIKKTLGFPFVRLPDALLPHANPIFALVKSDRSRRLTMLGVTYMTLADLDYF